MNGLLLTLSLVFQTLLPGTSERLVELAARAAPAKESAAAEDQRQLAPLPLLQGTVTGPKTATAFLTLDMGSLSVMGEREPTKKLPIASLTKIMTAIVILQTEDLDRVLTVGEVSLLPDESRMGLLKGEKIKVRELIRGLLIPSGSDSARVLAENYPGGPKGLIDKMNETAGRLGLKDTHFTNPVGLDEEGNYSTAADLAVLARYALRNDFFRETISLRTYRALSEDGRTHLLVNTNLILDGRTIIGLKTGRTEAAGECLISLYSIGGHEVLSIILGSSDRFSESSVHLGSLRKSVSWESA